MSGGARLPATVAAERPAGSALRVLVRPDDLRLRAAEEPAALAGTVLTHSFLGPVTRLGVQLDGSDDVVRVDLPSDAASGYPPGTSVGLDAAPEAALLAAS